MIRQESPWLQPGEYVKRESAKIVLGKNILKVQNTKILNVCRMALIYQSRHVLRVTNIVVMGINTSYLAVVSVIKT